MQDQPRSTNLSSLLEDARRRLVETGTRNRLVHVNRSAKRANVLDIIEERSADVLELLKTQGKKMRFQPRDEEEEDQPEDEPLLLALADDAEAPEYREARYRDLLLETRLGPEALQRRLLRLFTDARTAEEEHGVNILYLAMGFLLSMKPPPRCWTRGAHSGLRGQPFQRHADSHSGVRGQSSRGMLSV